ncbi:hypothetical protein CPB85DRAFT_1432927 [Mucidula mucida]|nr:hypothetical protein CPB85DRAFT_1432927 [Mucidula mucida]
MDKPKCKHLVLDAGPLLSLSPLRGLAEIYVTVPQVLEELKDRQAREHLERLGLNYGIKIEVKSPSAASLATVIQWAKKTGDYSVLSHPDLCVLALTHTLHEQAKTERLLKRTDSIEPTTDIDNAPNTEVIVDENIDADLPPSSDSEDDEHDHPAEGDKTGEQDLEPLNVELTPISSSAPPPPPPALSKPSNEPLFDDPSDSDDGEGEWITPSNVAMHKSKALDLLPSAKAKGKADEFLPVGCMTADFAMQNVLLQMGSILSVLKASAFKKSRAGFYDNMQRLVKKFCPSCGNPSLLRASVTIAAPGAGPNVPAMQVHLKPNFQYRIRGTKYSIPAPKSGSAKTGPGEGLILREDQTEYMRAKKRADTKREREEAKMMKGLLARGAAGDGGVAVGSWMDPDWVPEIMSVGSGGKGRSMRSSGMDGDMPVIGYGKKNPNERRRKK